MILVNTTVQKVEIYCSSAAITSGGRVELREGRNTICLTGLPDNIEKDSLKVTVFDCLMQGPVSVERRNCSTDDEMRDKLEELKERLEELNIQIKTVYDICDVFKEGSKASRNETKDQEDWFDFLRKIADQIILERDKYSELERERRKVQKQISELRDKMENIKKKEETVAILTLMAEKAGVYNLEVEYRDQNVSWKPEYSIIVPSVDEKIQIVLNAIIRQTTGKDWEDVSLILHTGNPALHPVMPKLKPWLIGSRPTSSKYYSARLGASGRNAYISGSAGESILGEIYSNDASSLETTVLATADGDATIVTPDRKPKASGIQFLTEGPEISTLLTEYRIKGKWSIPANKEENDGTIIIIDEFLLDGEFTYSSVPKTSKMVFLTAVIKNIPIDKMPTAAASIYFENRFMGQMRLDTSSMIDGLTLSLGVDQGLQVTRKQTGDEKNKVFMSGKTRRTSLFEITVQNAKDRAVEIKVYDQIPITNDSQIMIEEMDPNPQYGYNPETGEVIWSIIVPPRDKVRLYLSYAVTYPQNMRVYY